MGDVAQISGRSGRGLVAASLLSLAANLPVFLVGTLAVFMRRDLGFGEAALGVAVAAPTAAVALASATAGRFVERVGVTTALRVGTVGAMVSMLAIALMAGHVVLLVAFLFAAGMAAAVNQPAVNLWLVRTIPPSRQGVAFGVKQAAVPAGSMLAGLAVPAIAVTYGWRWVFVASAGLALVVLPLVPRAGPRGLGPGKISRAGDMSLRVMVVLAVAMGLGMAAAIAFTGFAVTTAVLAGMSESAAGYLFAAGAVVGMVTRVGLGIVVDRRGGNLLVVAGLLAVGAVGNLLMATGSRGHVVVAIPLVFATMWGWPGLFHLIVARVNANAPAAASGITLTGGASGAVLGPLLFGVVAGSSYTTAWCIGTVWALASSVAMVVAHRLVARESERQSLVPHPG